MSLITTAIPTPNPYEQKGYNSRAHYLTCLAHTYKVDHASVIALAELLGPTEDFDGLIAELEDFSQFL